MKKCLPNLFMSGQGYDSRAHGQKNVVFVATENDSVYAYDADSTNLFWHISLVGSNEEPYQISTCFITPQLGGDSNPRSLIII